MPMTERECNLSSIAFQNGVHNMDIEIFVVFIELRFPGENDSQYLGEWARRFSNGTAWSACDSTSRLMLLTAECEVRARYGTPYRFELVKSSEESA